MEYIISLQGGYLIFFLYFSRTKSYNNNIKKHIKV